MCLVSLTLIAHVLDMIGSTKRLSTLKDLTLNEIIIIELIIGAQNSTMYCISVNLQ